jgi:hypothetical protein
LKLRKANLKNRLLKNRLPKKQAAEKLLIALGSGSAGLQASVKVLYLCPEPALAGC